MPVFSNTVSQVTNTLNRSDSSASEVAQSILNDPSLTSRLLKTVNSAYFNPTGQPINTVSRAVMLLGFDHVKRLTMSLMLIDNLTEGEHRNQLVAEVAQAIHAATQAQQFMLLNASMKDAEEIFVATLLSRLGKMAFWAFADEEADSLMAELEAHDNSDAAEQAVLGFDLKDLTKALSQEWSLGDVLNDFLDGKLDEKRTACMDAGIALAELTHNGWDEEAAESILNALSKELDTKASSLKKLSQDNIEKAQDVAKIYGSYEASALIKNSGSDASIVEGSAPEVATEDSVQTNIETVEEFEASEFPEPNMNYQMQVLTELNATLQEKPSIGIILEMVLEGVYRGVGTDRVMFMMLNPLRTSLQCKYALGKDAEGLLKEFTIDITKPDNVFTKVIASKQPRLLPNNPAQLGGTLSRDTLTKLGKPPYMVMPAIVKDKVIGAFVADRNLSGRTLESSDFLAFQQFCQQANMGLTILALQG